MKYLQKCCFTLVLICILVACGSEVKPPNTTYTPYQNPATQKAQVSQDATSTYPTDNPQLNRNTYPPISTNSTNLPIGPSFSLNVPITAENSQVCGTSEMPDVPLKLISVTQDGEALGETTVAKNNTFCFSLQSRLRKGDTIGVVLGSIEGTNIDKSQFIYSSEYIDIPRIGIIFVMTSVQ